MIDEVVFWFGFAAASYFGIVGFVTTILLLGMSGSHRLPRLRCAVLDHNWKQSATQLDKGRSLRLEMKCASCGDHWGVEITPEQMGGY